MKFISSLISIGMPFRACSHSVKSLTTHEKLGVVADNLCQSNGSQKSRSIIRSFIGLEGDFNAAFISSAQVI